jgi:hypothetical protein
MNSPIPQKAGDKRTGREGVGRPRAIGGVCEEEQFFSCENLILIERFFI